MPETTQFSGDEELIGEGLLTANTILMNRYRILGVLGGGGQGAVYSGRDLNFPDAKRLVAIKELRYPAENPNVRQVALSTFRREANILATLNHPAIPKIYDFFDLNNRAYLVMEYINGSDLELLLSKTRELPMEKIIEWAIDLCDVLQYLHNHQPDPIIFRDVKPANIMIDSLGKVRLIDFGIAKKFVSGVKNTMIGTEGYSAPEQYKGDVNPISDIYGLAATLHHIITRKDPRLEPPFSFHERPIRDFNPKAPQSLQGILDRALAMDPVERYPHAEAMKDALIRLRNGPKVVSADGNGADGTNFFDMEGRAEAKFEPRWHFKTEDEIRGGVIVSHKLALFGSYDTNMWAIDINSGDFTWKYATTGGIVTTPVVNDKTGLIYFGSEDSNLYALDVKSGSLAWTSDTKGRVRSSPRIAHDHVFFGSDDGFLYAVYSSNGRKVWEQDLGAPIRTRPYVTKDLIIVGVESGELAGLELSGNRKWGSDLSKRGRPVSSSPCVAEEEGMCFVGCFDGYIYAVDISSGFTMWRYRTGKPIITTPLYHERTVYFGSVDGNLYALNSETAKERWRFSTEKPIVGSPMIHDDKIYFGGTDGAFYCLDLQTGKQHWKYETEEAITGSPYATDELVLIGSMDYTLYAFPIIS
jgi:eukaryotic-like serine/threonine-protein kinase